MPRHARRKSKSGYYHVLLRGIGRQNIFEDDQDRQRFIETLIRYKREMNFEIHAYCLMGNHVHLLLKDTDCQLDLIMKKIAGSYAYYFNRKYDRVGHLFQDRFKSETIEDESYYLTVFRYIHQNPLKAGISNVDDYKWSSYCEFQNQNNFIDTDFVFSLIGDFKRIKSFLKEHDDSVCLDVNTNQRITDKTALEILSERYEIESFMMIQKLSIKDRNMILHALKDEGLSIRQLERLTGLNRGVIQRA